jgi:hypothetical protein
MTEHASGLTDKEFDEFNDIVGDTIDRLLECADKNNIDRDSFVQYFATMFMAMSQVSTFKEYGKERKQ